MEEKYIELITETSERAKSNTHQIEEVKNDIRDIKEEYKIINRLATSIELLVRDMTHVKSDIVEIKDVQSVTQASLSEMRSDMKTELSEVRNEDIVKKAKTYENIKSIVIGLIVSGIAGFILGTVAPAIFGK